MALWLHNSIVLQRKIELRDFLRNKSSTQKFFGSLDFMTT